jgi:hypothetical protein
LRGGQDIDFLYFAGGELVGQVFVQVDAADAVRTAADQAAIRIGIGGYCPAVGAGAG